MQNGTRSGEDAGRPLQPQTAPILPLHVALDSALFGVYVLDLTGRCTYINRSATELLGCDREELIGSLLGQLIEPVDPVQDRGRIEATSAASGRAFRDGVVQRRDGQMRTVEFSVDPVNNDGATAGTIVTFHDVTEQRQAEQRLRDEVRISDTLHHIGRSLSAELDLEHIVQIATDAATESTGAEVGAFFFNMVDQDGESFRLYTLSGARREEFGHLPMPRNTGIFRPTFRGEGVVRLDDVTSDSRYGHNPPYHGMPDGHLPVRSYLAVPIISRWGTVLGGLFLGHPEAGKFSQQSERLAIGIAAQAATAIDNAQLYQREQQATRQREEFLSIASHELKTPLTTIKGYTELVKRQVDRDQIEPHRLNKATSQLLAQVTRLETLVNDLLDISRIQQGRLALRRERFDIVALADQVVNRFQQSAELNPDHRLSLDASAPVEGYWDLNQIDQVLTNLISNAVKFSPEGGQVQVRVGLRNDRAEITVSDTGIGIAPEDQATLFQPFVRCGPARRDVRGMGLGLYISREIVRQHDGRLTLRSNPGVGTTVTVELPLESRRSNESHNQNP